MAAKRINIPRPEVPTIVEGGHHLLMSLTTGAGTTALLSPLG